MMRMTVLATMLLTSSMALAKPPPKDGVYLVVATATRSSILGEDQESWTLNFRIKLKLDHVVHGPSRDFPKTFAIDLKASDDTVILKSQLHVLVEIADGKLRLLNWGVVSQLACIPTTLVPAAFAASYFQSPFPDGRERSCIKVD